MKIFGFEIKINRLRKETDEEIRERIKKLCEKDESCNHSKYSMHAQTAVNELCDHLLGGDWYIVDSVNNVQANAIIVYEIERKYKKVRR